MRVEMPEAARLVQVGQQQMGAAMALTSSTATADGNSRRAGEPGLPKAEKAAVNAVVALMPTRKKYCTAQGSQAAS